MTNKELPLADMGPLNPEAEPVNNPYKLEYSQEEIDSMMGLDDNCPYCDEGFVYDCIDDQCIDAEIGCDLCAQRCEYCS